MELSKIIALILIGAFLVFLRNANLKAHRQKITATRLSSYLDYWKGKVIEKNWFNIYYIGIKWNEEIQEIIENGGDGQELVDLEKEKRKFVTTIKDAIKSSDPIVNITKGDVINEINKIPKIIRDDMNDLAATIQNLLDGKTFINDEDASCLSPRIARVCIALKMELVAFIYSANILMFRIINEIDNFEFVNYAEEISELIWKAIIISKHIDSLSTQIDKYIDKNIFRLTLDNIRI